APGSRLDIIGSSTKSPTANSDASRCSTGEYPPRKKYRPAESPAYPAPAAEEVPAGEEPVVPGLGRGEVVDHVDHVEEARDVRHQAAFAISSPQRSMKAYRYSSVNLPSGGNGANPIRRVPP